MVRTTGLLLGAAALALTTAESLLQLGTLLERSFWPVLLVSWVVLAVTLWPEQQKREAGFKPTSRSPKHWLFRFRWVLLATGLCLVVAVHHAWDVYGKSEGSHPYPGPIPPLSALIGGSVYANELKEPVVTRFSLVEDKTSFRESLQPKFGAGPRIKTYSLSYDLMRPIWDGRCRYGFDDLSAQRALESFALGNGRVNLIKYIDSPKAVRRLVKDHPDKASELLPRGSEWRTLSPFEYEAILGWVRECIGIPYPVFNITLENRAKRPLLVTALVYNVSEVGQVMGGEPGPLSPRVRYVHELKYEAGTQRRELSSVFEIPPEGARAFELQLETKHPDLGLCWLVRIDIETNQGTVSTEEFQLILSGKPSWAQGRIK